MLGLVKNIKKLLNIHDLTQKEFAKILGISSSALGNYIQNTREPDYLTLIQIANYFQVTVDFLLNCSNNTNLSHSEQCLIHIFRCLSDEQQEFYLEQGQIFIRQNRKKRSCLSQNDECFDVS